MKHEEIIELLSCVMNKLDRKGELGAGDVVMDIICSLKDEWDLNDG